MLFRSDALREIAGRLMKLKAEEAGVAAALQSAADSLWPPLLDALSVEPGFEKALGAAFGDDLEASSDRGAPSHWLPLDPYMDVPGLPEGATPLSEHVKALPELARRIAFIGLVADEATGAALQSSLRPGQQLVTRDGALWRWDGYTVRAGAPLPAAVRLSQRNRLAEIRGQIDGVAAEQDTAQQAVDQESTLLAAAREVERTSVEQAREHERTVGEASRRKTQDAGEATRAAERSAQETTAAAETVATAARERHAQVSRQTDQLRTRLAGIEQAMAELSADVADAEMRRTFRQARLSAISDTQADRVTAGALRTRIAELRANLVEAEATCERLARESEMRVERLGQIAHDHASWSTRLSDAEGQIVELDQRREQIAQQIAELAAKPDAEREFDTARGISAADFRVLDAAGKHHVGEVAEIGRAHV